MNVTTLSDPALSIGFRNTVERTPAIEGLRGFAMILVFWGHFEVLFHDFLVRGSLSDNVVDFFSVWGHRGVAFFFVITGYFVYSTFMDRPTDYSAFVKKRLCRVLPLYWFMLILYLALSVAVPSESKLPADPTEAAVYFAQNALFVQGFMRRPMIVVSWALTYLILAYLALPAVVIAARLRQWAPWQRVLLVFAGAAVWLTACRAYSALSPRPVVIAVGMLVYEAVRTRSFRRWLNTFGEALATSILVLSLTAWYAMDKRVVTLPYEFRYFFLGLGIFSVCLCIVAYDGVLRTLCANRLLTKLGRQGYAYYLIHGLTLKAVLVVMTAMTVSTRDSSVTFWILLPISFVATLFTSTALYRCVEMPLGRVLQGNGRRFVESRLLSLPARLGST